MKRVIDEKTLKALYPPMETAFETQMRQTLRSLPVERRHRGARRKPAAVLVAAAVLALLAATALAIAALSGFFTEATALPLNSSYMENWSLGEKEAVAALLVQYDLPEDRAAWEDALQESSARRREAALDALFIEHYAVTSGGRRNISLHSIMQQELGELDPEWSLEQKAAYSALESEFELGGADEDVNLLPGEDDIPREEAVKIAKDAIQAAFGFTDEQMENAALWELSFLVHRSELGVKPPYYSVCLAICDETNVWKAEYAAISGRARCSRARTVTLAWNLRRKRRRRFIRLRITSRMRSIRTERASWRAMGRRSRRLSRRSSHGKISELTSC